MDHLEQVATAELSYRHAQRIRRALFTLAALSSLAPWLRALDLSFVPRSLSNGLVAVWSALLMGALASRVEEWQLRRVWQRCVSRKGGS